MKMNVYRNYDFSYFLFTLLGFRTEAFLIVTRTLNGVL